jgi:hypothetical protein
MKRTRRNCSQEEEQQSLCRIDYRGNNDLLILTRLLLSSDDSDNNFPRTPPQTRTEIKINQATPMTRTRTV